MSTWRAASQAVDGRAGLQGNGFDKVVEGGVSMMLEKAAGVSKRIGDQRTAVVASSTEAAKPILQAIREVLEADEDNAEKMQEKAMAVTEGEEADIAYKSFRKYEAHQQKLVACQKEIESLNTKHPCRATAFAAMLASLPVADHPEEMSSIVGRAVGSLTTLQALNRPLKVGETRPTLAARCLKGLSKKMLLSADPKLTMSLNQLAGTQEAPPAPQVAEQPVAEGALV